MKRLLGAALALLVVPAGAHDSSAQLEQRLRMAAQLINDSPAVQRIQRSGNGVAEGHLNEGRLHLSLAEDALRRGDGAGARQAVDEALRHVGMARRLVPNTQLQQASAQRRGEQLLATLERLVESWRVQAASRQVQDNDLVAAVGLMGNARYLADSGRHIEAVRALEQAERHVFSGMNRVLQQRELDYTQRASTPEQEFQLELQRHQAMAELLPLAVSELKPGGDALRLIERYGNDSRSLRAQALQLQQQGELAQAMARLRSAMSYVQRGLQAAGVATPAATDGTPP
jgi:tetratricopeptide (TPR) repeat protein